MKTWETIKALTENPEYKAKRIKNNAGDIGDMICFRNNILCWNNDFNFPFHIALTYKNDEWEIIKQPKQYDSVKILKGIGTGLTGTITDIDINDYERPLSISCEGREVDGTFYCGYEDVKVLSQQS